MSPRHFHAAAALSLVLCLAFAALWARSFFVADVVMIGWCNLVVGLEPRPGWCAVGVATTDRWEFGLSRHPIRAGETDEKRLASATSFAAYIQAYPASVRFEGWFYHWWFCLLFGILPLAWLWWKALRRPAVNQCRACGYDLRASANARVCPECGADPEVSA